MQDLFEEYLDRNKMCSFEGERGVKNMIQIMREVCEYKPGWNGTLENFFIDNPGACQAVVEWIGSQRNDEWRTNLECLVGESDEEPALPDLAGVPTWTEP